MDTGERGMSNYALVVARDDIIIIEMSGTPKFISRESDWEKALLKIGEREGFQVEVTAYRGDFICELLDKFSEPAPTPPPVS
jgi:hypothetical protein